MCTATWPRRSLRKASDLHSPSEIQRYEVTFAIGSESRPGTIVITPNAYTWDWNADPPGTDRKIYGIYVSAALEEGTYNFCTSDFVSPSCFATIRDLIVRKTPETECLFGHDGNLMLNFQWFTGDWLQIAGDIPATDWEATPPESKLRGTLQCYVDVKASARAAKEIDELLAYVGRLERSLDTPQ